MFKHHLMHRFSRRRPDGRRLLNHRSLNHLTASGALLLMAWTAPIQASSGKPLTDPPDAWRTSDSVDWLDPSTDDWHQEKAAGAAPSNDAPPAFFQPALESGQVSQFSGAASYSVPIPVPEGVGGLKLPLTLRYSSDLVSSKVGDFNSDGGWVGLGWDLEVGRIELTNRTHGDTRLLLGGQSSTLVHADNESSTDCTDGDDFLPAEERWDCIEKREDRFNVEEARFWRIKRTSRTWEKDVCECVEGCKQVASVPGRIVDDAKWEITDKGGVKYEFGAQAYDNLPWQNWAGPGPNASSRAYHLQYRDGEGPDYKEAVFRSWGLEKMEDLQGNTLKVHWKGYNTLDGWSHNCSEAGLGLPHWGFKEIYPSTIRYTTNDGQDDDDVEWEVEFLTSRKQFDTLEDFGIAQSGVKLDAIKVWFYPPNGDPAILTSEHKFVYAVDHVDDTKSYRLTRIDRYGKHGSGSGYDNQLPSLHFDYELRTIQWNQTTYQRYFLTHVDDSIGGGLTFAMQDWNAPEYTKQVVQSKTVHPGIGMQEVTTFDYLDAVTETEDDGTERLVGFGRVRQNRTDRRVESTYLVYGSDPDHILTGKRHTRQVEDLAGTPLTLSEWKWWPEAREGQSGTAGYFVKKYEELDWMWDELGQEHSKKTHFLFDPALQGDEQGGNVTTVYYYDDADAAPGDMYRSTVHRYGRNLNAWILDRKIETTEHAGAPDSNWLRRSRWIWNLGATPDHTIVADSGLLYAHRRSVVHSVGERMVDRAYRYDEFGNQDEEWIYYGFGLNDQYPANYCSILREYDGTKSFLITETNCLGHQTDYYYYGFRQGAGGEGLPGQPQMVRDLNGLFTNAVQYDLKGRARYRWSYGTTIWDTSQASEILSYSTPDRWMKRQIRDDASDAVHYRTDRTFYDALGRVVQTQQNWGSGNRRMVHTHYLPNGLTERTTTPSLKAWSGDGMDVTEWNRTDLHQTSYTYDALGRVKTKETTGRGTTQYAYYGPWGQVSEANANSTLQRTQVYDTRGHSIRTEEWNMQTGAGSETVATHRHYDVLGQLTDIYDDEGNRWRFNYDALGQKTWQLDPGRGAQVFTYNARGLMRHHRNAALERTCYWFDDIGRTTGRKTVGNALCPSTVPTDADATFTYDAGSLGLGRRTGMQTADVTVAWTYDGRGRKTHEVTDYPGRQGPYTTRWTYHQDDRISTLRYPDGTLALYGYHGASGLPRTLYVDNQPVVGETTYDPLGRIEHMELGNGYDIDRTFGTTNLRLHTLTSSHSGHGDSFGMQYHWDVLGNLKYFYDFRGADDVFEDAYFGYDFLGRLTRAWTDHSDAPYDLSYGYDSLGNLETVQNHLTGVTDTWTYQAGIPHAKTHRNGVQKLTYDNLGRVIDRQSDANGSFQYTWDTAQRLLSVQGPSGHHTLVRDADGRLAANLWAAQDTYYVNPLYEETFVHLIGGEGIVGGQDVDLAKAGGSPTSTRATFLFGDQAIAQRTTTGPSTATHYLHPDHQGSVHMVTDASGNVVRRSRYLPYGQERWMTGSGSNSDYDFHGERKFDRYGGVHAMGVRFYDPEYRTWLSADTILPNVERPQSLNAYAFVEGNPLRYTDPSGHSAEDEDPAERMDEQVEAIGWLIFILDLMDELPEGVGDVVGGVIYIYDTYRAHEIYHERIDEIMAGPNDPRQNLYADVAFGELLYDTGTGGTEMGAGILATAGGNPYVAVGTIAITLTDKAGTALADYFGVGMVPRKAAGYLSGALGTITEPYATSDPNCDSLCLTASLEYDQTGNAGDAIIFVAQAADNARDLRDLGGQIVENGRQRVNDWLGRWGL